MPLVILIIEAVIGFSLRDSGKETFGFLKLNKFVFQWLCYRALSLNSLNELIGCTEGHECEDNSSDGNENGASHSPRTSMGNEICDCLLLSELLLPLFQKILWF